jgi:hypothetical protein
MCNNSLYHAAYKCTTTSFNKQLYKQVGVDNSLQRATRYSNCGTASTHKSTRTLDLSPNAYARLQLSMISNADPSKRQFTKFTILGIV